MVEIAEPLTDLRAESAVVDAFVTGAGRSPRPANPEGRTHLDLDHPDG
jgi:hypothetical protein